jgi:cell division protein ZapA (FtsZ GTPase activity inhibitor)
MNQDMLPMTLTIAGMKCFVTEPRKDEGMFREAAKRINDLIAQYRTKHANTDIYLLLAYTTLHLTIDLIKKEQSNDVGPVLECIRKVNQKLSDVI